MTGGRERVRTEDDRAERVGWMVKRSRRYLGWEYCRAEVLNLFWLTTHLNLQINLATHHAIIIIYVNIVKIKNVKVKPIHLFKIFNC